MGFRWGGWRKPKTRTMAQVPSTQGGSGAPLTLEEVVVELVVNGNVAEGDILRPTATTHVRTSTVPA